MTCWRYWALPGFASTPSEGVLNEFLKESNQGHGEEQGKAG